MICAFIQIANQNKLIPRELRFFVDVDGICIYMAIYSLGLIILIYLTVWLFLGIFNVVIS
jgi:hypothetical protein